MKVETTKKDSLTLELHVTIEASVLSEKIDAKLKKLGSELKMPGFRQGKVPAKVIKQKHGTAVMGETLDEIIQEYSAKAIEHEKLQPAAQPKAELKVFEEGKDVEFALTVELLPEIPEIKFDKINLEQLVIEINENDLTDGLTRLQSQFKDYKSLPKTQKAEPGNAVLIDYEGKKEGVPFEGGAAKGHKLELGSNSFIPGFEEQLVGTKAGDSKTLNITFPEVYHSQELAGKETTFDVTVHEVLEVTPHEINDALAQKVGSKDLNELKERVKKQLSADFDEMTRAHIKRELFDTLEKECDFEVPASMFEQEFSTLWKQAEEQNKNQPGFFDKPEDEMKKEYEDVARRRIRLGILLAEIGKNEKIQVLPQDIEAAITKEAMKYPGQEHHILTYYQEHPEAKANFSGAILEEKVVDFLLEKVNTKEKRISTDEWWKLSNKELNDDTKPAKKQSAKKKAS